MIRFLEPSTLRTHTTSIEDWVNIRVRPRFPFASRCQPSIIGGWGGLTLRKFRWSELRFERFVLMPYTGNTIIYESGKSMGSMRRYKNTTRWMAPPI